MCVFASSFIQTSKVLGFGFVFVFQSPRVILIFGKVLQLKQNKKKKKAVGRNISTQARKILLRKKQLSSQSMDFDCRDINEKCEIQILVLPCLLCDFGQLI